MVGNRTPHIAVYSNAEGVQSAKKPLYFFLERYMDANLAEMKVFIDCIVQDTRRPGPAWVAVSRWSWGRLPGNLIGKIDWSN